MLSTTFVKNAKIASSIWLLLLQKINGNFLPTRLWANPAPLWRSRSPQHKVSSDFRSHKIVLRYHHPPPPRFRPQRATPTSTRKDDASFHSNTAGLRPRGALRDGGVRAPRRAPTAARRRRAAGVREGAAPTTRAATPRRRRDAGRAVHVARLFPEPGPVHVPADGR